MLLELTKAVYTINIYSKVTCKKEKGKDRGRQLQVQKSKRDNPEKSICWLLNTYNYVSFSPTRSPPSIPPPTNAKMSLHSL